MDQEIISNQPIIDVNLEQLCLFKQNNKIVVFYGFPYDEGTVRNKGRAGGSAAYEQIITSLKTYLKNKEFDYPILHLSSTSALPKNLELEQAHQNLYYTIAEIYHQLPQAIVIVLGGSNDQSYQNFKGLIDGTQCQKVGVINLDSHYDVRPLVNGQSHSGSPFRQMLEDKERFKDSEFVEFGIKGCTSSFDHYNFVLKNNGRVFFMEKDIRRNDNQDINNLQAVNVMEKILQQWEQDKTIQHIFYSFDLDVINSVWMPGVSAPSIVGGLTQMEAIGLMDLAGKQKKIKLIDMSEFNPAVECMRSIELIVQMINKYLQSYQQQ